ncbi:hypothetical protein BGZ80_010151 [Entomortierella chlamydospora]|uniref:Uncharacterized protein n=1 Tax=Entomortierella chlamydospora TaxID=101097 RepID=A0A9P6T077_9FUNG|nr:hypothetical protein BGZ79_003432 [Entomortierella chlamydospora]KAG0014916.1 hypothetical protein BGZ80_010151 [Entomortierella chlamydospora]
MWGKQVEGTYIFFVPASIACLISAIVRARIATPSSSKSYSISASDEEPSDSQHSSGWLSKKLWYISGRQLVRLFSSPLSEMSSLVFVSDKIRSLIASSKNVVASPPITDPDGELLDVDGAINSDSAVSSDIGGSCAHGVADALGSDVIVGVDSVDFGDVVDKEVLLLDVEDGAEFVVGVAVAVTLEQGIVADGKSDMPSMGLCGERGKEVRERVEKDSTSTATASVEVVSGGDKTCGSGAMDIKEEGGEDEGDDNEDVEARSWFLVVEAMTLVYFW